MRWQLSRSSSQTWRISKWWAAHHLSLKYVQVKTPVGVFWTLCRLYKERLGQMDLKLQEVMAGSAAEYLEPLATLQENMQIRTKVAGQLMLGLYLHTWYSWCSLKGLQSSRQCLINYTVKQRSTLFQVRSTAFKAMVYYYHFNLK